MLRSGASWLMGITLGAVAVAATLAVLHYSSAALPERVLAYVLRLLLLLLAVEITFNFVLDFYRPRGPDEEPRPAFDSRLFGLFAEPGGIAPRNATSGCRHHDPTSFVRRGDAAYCPCCNRWMGNYRKA